MKKKKTKLEIMTETIKYMLMSEKEKKEKKETPNLIEIYENNEE